MRTWVNALVLLGVTSLLAIGAARRGPSAVVAGVDPGLASLERAAADSPRDSHAAIALAKAYLEKGAPGLAVSVLERTPAAASTSASSADTAARAYFAAGHASESLAMTKLALAHCETEACDATFMARSVRRENLLEALVDMGVEDADQNPTAVELAYRRSTRQVRIAMN